MKKFFSCVLCLFMVLTAVMSVVLLCKPNSKTIIQAQAASTTEGSISNKYDIIGINPGIYANATTEALTPFNIETKTMMEGKSLKPLADKYGQISGVTFLTNSYEINSKQSIYFWVYLLDTETYELTIKIGDGATSYMSWFFDSSETKLFDSGWKLIELKASESQFTGEGDDKYALTYTTFSLSYVSEIKENISENLGETDERLSVYHVYLGDSYKQNPYSGKIDGLSRAYAEFSSDFLSSSKMFKGDEVSFTNPSKVFEFLIVGKTSFDDIKDKTDYSWKITVSRPDGSDLSLDFGDSFTFENQGYYTVNVKLYEKNKLLNESLDFSKKMILNLSRDVFCEEMALGGFMIGATYQIKNNETLAIEFAIAPGIKISGDIEVEFSNNYAQVESKYEKDGIYYVQVKGISPGTTIMTIKATASSVNGTNYKNYTSEAKIHVVDSEDTDKMSMTVLWVTFGLFCAYFTGFLINSLVKARKNDVK